MARLSLIRHPPEWGVEPVPPGERQMRAVDFFVLWFSLGVGLLVLYAGTFITFYGFGLIPLIFIVLGGSAVGSLLLAAAGTIGTRHGVPTMVSLRPIFGRRGSYVPSVLNAAQLFGWTFLEIWVMSVAATALSGPFLGPGTGAVWALAFGVFCGLLAWGGPVVVVRFWLERVGIWLVVASAGWITFRLATLPPLGAGIPMWGGDWTKTGLGLDLVIAMPISWWPLVADYNRFAQSPRKAFVGTAVGYGAANTWFYALGAVMVVALGLSDTSDVFASTIVGIFGPLVLLAILADETDNGFANIYSTSVSIQNVRPRTRLARLVPLVTAIGIVVAAILSGIPLASVLAYQPFLLIVGGVFVPMLGVVLADVYVVRGSGYGEEEFREAPTNRRVHAFVAWALGMLVYFPIFLVNLYGLPVDLLGLNLVGASVPAFATSAIAYLTVSRLGATTPTGPRHEWRQFLAFGRWRRAGSSSSRKTGRSFK